MTFANGILDGEALNYLLPQPPLMAVIGDSIVKQNSSWDETTGDPVNGVLRGANGPDVMAVALAHQRVHLPHNYIFGYPGLETSDVIANMAKIIALNPRPSVVKVAAGTNNIVHATATGTATAIIADLTTIVNYFLGYGIRVILAPIRPRAAMTAAMYGVLVEVNRWIAKVPSISNGRVAVPDFMRDVTASASLTAVTWAANMDQGDGIHPGVRGAYFEAKAEAAILRSWFPPLDWLPSSNMGFDATNAPGANLILNAQMQSGTGLGAGSLTTPSSGTIAGVAADAYTMSMSNTAGLTVTGSLVAAPWANSDNAAKLQQMAITGTYTVSGSSGGATFGHFARLYQGITNTKIVAGDTLEAFCYVEMDAPQALAFPNLQFRWGGSAKWNAEMHPAPRELPAEPISMVLRTPAHTFDVQPAAGDVQLLMLAYLKSYPDGSVTANDNIRWGRAAVFKNLH